MAARVGRSSLWYSDSGTYMSEVNRMLQRRPKSGATDEFGDRALDDDWERIWQECPEAWDQEII